MSANNGGDNISYRIEKGIMIIEIDLTKDLGPSQSGKTNLVATSHGYVTVDPNTRMSVNVIRKVR